MQIQPDGCPQPAAAATSSHNFFLIWGGFKRRKSDLPSHTAAVRNLIIRESVISFTGPVSRTLQCKKLLSIFQRSLFFYYSSQQDSAKQGISIHISKINIWSISLALGKTFKQFYTYLHTTAVKLVLHNVPSVGDPLLLRAHVVVLHAAFMFFTT